MDVPLKSLGLAQKWPELHKLQTEISDLEKRLHRARGAVSQAQGQLGPARERDLTEAGKAIRSGKAVPEPEHEPKVKAELEAADRTAEQVSRALQAAREDLGAYLAVHQAELYRDVLGARDAVAREAAEAAEVTRRAYSRYEDLARTVRDLTPAEQPDENARSLRVTNSFFGVHTV